MNRDDLVEPTPIDELPERTALRARYDEVFRALEELAARSPEERDAEQWRALVTEEERIARLLGMAGQHQLPSQPIS